MRVTSFIFATLLFATLAVAPNAQATPIRYELTGTGTGRIGNTSFTNASIDAVAFSDTTKVITFTDSGFTFHAAPFTSFTITIGGIGTANVTDISELFVVPQPVPNFTPIPGILFGRTDNPPDLTGFTGIGFDVNAALAGYSGATAIGPITGVGAFGFNPQCSTNGNDPCIGTSLGLLRFSSNPNSVEEVTTQTTFTATVTAVPEPATLLLLGTGVAALGRSRARSRRQSTK